MQLSSLVPEHAVELLGSRNIWRLYAVNFGRALQRGEVVEIAVRWNLTDKAGTAMPFFSQSVNEPTERLSFHLRLPEAFGVKKASTTVLPSIESLVPVESSTADMRLRNGFYELEWKVWHPRLLHCYQVSWLDPTGQRAPVQSVEIAAPAPIAPREYNTDSRIEDAT